MLSDELNSKEMEGLPTISFFPHCLGFLGSIVWTGWRRDVSLVRIVRVHHGPNGKLFILSFYLNRDRSKVFKSQVSVELLAHGTCEQCHGLFLRRCMLDTPAAEGGSCAPALVVGMSCKDAQVEVMRFMFAVEIRLLGRLDGSGEGIHACKVGVPAAF